MRHVRLRVIALALALVTGVTGTLYLLRPPAEAVAGEDLVTSPPPATAVVPATTSEPATTTSTVDPVAVIEYATRLWEATSTTTTTAPPTTLPPVTAPPVTRPTITRPAPTTTTIVPATVPVPDPGPPPEPVADDGPGLPPFLLCVRWHESHDTYTAVNPSSGAAGAFQFMSGTARAIAGWMGRPDLAGRTANTWSPADQDAAAMLLYQRSGASPWNGSGC